MPKQSVLPRWRGFNLLGAFLCDSPGFFAERDFQLIGELGFNFVRLPMNYTFWIRNNDPFAIDEAKLGFVDDALGWARANGLHVQMNMHRAPGFSVARDRIEPFSLWTDREAQDCFRLHWETFARRYQGVPASELSFNPINEPCDVDAATHDAAVLPAVAAIHAIDPERLVILDGLDYGTVPMPGVARQTGGRVAQSCRGYNPHHFTHYLAGWTQQPAGQGVPSWPFQDPNFAADDPAGRWDRGRLFAFYRDWAELAAATGTGVHCGEGGCYRHTPHEAVLAWLEDWLDALSVYNIGYALWNFRGPFGILDSERGDVRYEDWNGERLDRRMLSILQAH
ncbi:MAG: cellulase family glycosylhydrolase [Bacillota bacterium]|nr:cellulase family glycosylhydrolase [Bacillota bacterium]